MLNKQIMRMVTLAVLLFLPLLMLPRPLYSATVIDASEGETQFVKVSRKDLNRIIVPQENPKVFTASQSVDVKIEGKNVFVRMGDASVTSEIFLITGEHTYSLVLVPSEIPAQTIVLKPPATAGREAETWERDHDYVVTVKNLIKAMASDTVPEGYDLNEPGEDEKMWVFKNTTLRLLRRCQGFRLLGLEYGIENAGSEEANLSENEFYAPGILAVSIEKHALEPKEKTRIFVIKEAGSSE